MIKLITYKNKQYEVTEPGKLVYSKTRHLPGRTKDTERYEIVDQLNNCSELSGYRTKYLKTKYGLTELEYYIIVVCEGDESKLPRCTVNPYTGEKCEEPRKFRSLVPGFHQRTGKRKGIFHDGCKRHSSNAAAQIAQRENYQKGVTGLQRADRNSKIWREKLSIHAKKQMEEGRSIFSPDEVRNEDIPSWKDFILNDPLLSPYKNELSVSFGVNNLDNLDQDSCILVDKLVYLRRGNHDDMCSYYITYFEENPDIFKLGVTTNLNKRERVTYHGYNYKSAKILFTSDRVTIAELEYKVKLKFKNYITLGNEGFDIKYEKEIISYVEELINYYNNEEV